MSWAGPRAPGSITQACLRQCAFVVGLRRHLNLSSRVTLRAESYLGPLKLAIGCRKSSMYSGSGLTGWTTILGQTVWVVQGT